jgi:hypothetical protein
MDYGSVCQQSAARSDNMSAYWYSGTENSPD